jgi:glycosyltransferase involved in cell wall biosynthesis
MPANEVGHNDRPLVSIIMPVFNPGNGLEEAIKSILDQTYRNFELVIVRENRSQDNLTTILQRFNDNRVFLINNDRKLGLANSLNEGIKASRGELIARMDADDVAHPTRIEKQVEALERMPDVGVLGTHVDFTGNNPTYDYNEMLPERPSLIRWQMHFQNALAHPTVMMRRWVWDRLGGYNAETEPCEDYDLWLRAMRFTDIVNLPEHLITYRMNEYSVSSVRRKEQNNKATELSVRAIQITMGAPLDPKLIVSVIKPYSISEPRQGIKAAHLIYTLYINFLWWEKIRGADEIALKSIISKRLSHIFVRSFKVSPLFSSMVLWQIARFGPRTFGKVVIEIIKRVIEALRQK